jgi:hypothetical protein
MLDYRDKSIPYDYIFEEFHYEYKIDTDNIMKHLDLIAHDMKNKLDYKTKDYYIDYCRDYPEVKAEDLLTECKFDSRVINNYFVGYPNALELAKITYNCMQTNDYTLFNEEKLGIDGKLLVEHALATVKDLSDRRQVKRALYKRFSPHLTVIKNLYMVQSPKDKKTDLPTIHYSLKEKFLSDFRALRKVAKKNMEEAEKNHDHATQVRFNAKQLAIKVVCNSEYGASGNATFAHYDPDIAAAITHCARSLIGMLTSNLESHYIYVDQKFLDSHKQHIDPLIACNALRIEHDKYTYEELIRERRHVIRRVFNDVYELVDTNIYKLILEPAKVVYQDTDSNYYANYHIQNYFTKNLTECSPKIVNDMMYAMYHHNMLLSDFTTDAIARKPVGLGFEGSFIVCRYLNRKKKYYGRQWSPDGEIFPLMTLPNTNAYVNGILRKNYMKYYQKKVSIVPYPDGTYIHIDDDTLLNKPTNYLDYVKSFGCKCTGVDLARRDQYKYINYYHVYILQQDLKIMQYEGKNVWKINDKNMSIESIIRDVIFKFKGMLDAARVFVNDISNNRKRLVIKEPFERYLKFSLKAFAKTAAFRENKQNVVTKLMTKRVNDYKKELKQYAEELTAKDIETRFNKLIAEMKITPRLVKEYKSKINQKPSIDYAKKVKSEPLNEYDTKQYEDEIMTYYCKNRFMEECIEYYIKQFKPYIPKINERINFVVISRQHAKEMYEKAEFVSLLEEIIENDVKRAIINECIQSEILPSADINTYINYNCEHLYEQTYFYTDLDMPYEEFYSAFMLSKLDSEYYIEKLCSALVLYIIGDMFPHEVAELDDDETLTESVRNLRVNVLKKQAAYKFMVELGLMRPSTRKRKVDYYEKFKTDNELIKQAKIIAKYVNGIKVSDLDSNEKKLSAFINDSIFSLGFWNQIDTNIEETNKSIKDIDNAKDDAKKSLMLLQEAIDENGGKKKDFKVKISLHESAKQKLTAYAIKNKDDDDFVNTYSYYSDNFKTFGEDFLKETKNIIPCTLLDEGFYDFLNGTDLDTEYENKLKGYHLQVKEMTTAKTYFENKYGNYAK